MAKQPESDVNVASERRAKSINLRTELMSMRQAQGWQRVNRLWRTDDKQKQ